MKKTNKKKTKHDETPKLREVSDSDLRQATGGAGTNLAGNNLAGSN
jgi:hypothetical protein